MISTSQAPLALGRAAVTIGKFDAIHKGHQALISFLVEEARVRDLPVVVLTFDRHPNHVVRPGTAPFPVIGKNQKLRLLAELGVDICWTIHFDEQLAHLSPEEFVKHYVLACKAEIAIVGDQFQFGSNASGNLSTLIDLGKEYGFQVHSLTVSVDGAEKISTGKIRELLEKGLVAEANQLLGRNHATEGIVEHGRKLGRTLGYPTANLARDSEGLLPADGVYAGYLIADGIRYPAAHSVGTNDSIEAVPRLLESHVIGRDDLDLYGRTVVCEYVAKVRGWAKFDSVEQLKAQIADDVAKAKQLLLSRVDL